MLGRQGYEGYLKGLGSDEVMGGMEEDEDEDDEDDDIESEPGEAVVVPSRLPILPSQGLTLVPPAQRRFR